MGRAHTIRNVQPMKIQINAPEVQVHDEFAAHIEERLLEVLAPFGDWLTRIEVHLEDQNGAKGGVDTRCLLEARPRGGAARV